MRRDRRYHVRNRLAKSGRALLFGVLATLMVPCAGAQSQRSETLKIFVPPFEYSRGPQADDQGAAMAPFATQLVRLTLLRLRGAVVQSEKPPRCTPRQSLAPQAQLANRASTSSPVDESSYYLVSGRIEGDSASAVADIEFSWCVGGSVRVLSHDKRRIPVRNAILEFTDMADELAQVLRASLPRTRVAVGPPIAERREAAPGVRELRSAKEHLVAELSAADQYRVVEPGDSADFTATVDVALRDSAVTARVVLRRTNGSSRVDSITATRAGGAFVDVYATLAKRVVARLDLLRNAPGLGVADSVGAQPAELRARARAALCLDDRANCRADADVAVRALRAAPTARDSRHDRMLLGRAEEMLGHHEAAVAAYRAALGPITAGAAADSLTALEQTAVLRGLLDIFTASANATSALEIYDELLRRTPNDTLKLGRARTLVYAGRRLDAMLYLGRIVREGGQQTFVREFERELRDMPPSELAVGAEALRPVCLSDPRLREICTDVFTIAADALNKSRVTVADPTALYATLLALDGTGSNAAKYLVLLAEGLIGNSVYGQESPGRIFRVAAAGTRPDSGEVVLARAERLGVRDAELRSRLLRARAELEIARARYAQAVDAARSSLESRRSPLSLLLAAQASMLYAQQVEDSVPGRPTTVAAESARLLRESALQYLSALVDDRQPYAYFYFREAAHALGRDGEAKTQLQQIVQRNAKDKEAVRVLATLCVDYAPDFPCAFDMSRILVEDTPTALLDDALNGVEAAVLADQFDVAIQWNDPLWGRTPNSCLRAVSSFYDFWAASATRQSAREASAQRRWTAAVGEYEKESGVCWYFRGARARLLAPSAPHNAEVLRSMIARMERTSPPAR